MDAMRKGLPDPVEAWLFDLDDTLYPAASNLFREVAERMTDYIADLLGLGRKEAEGVRRRFFRHYGTTLKGMMTEYGMDPVPFLDYVHDIDATVIAPDPRLDAALSRLEGRKLIQTNGSVRHAQNILGRLAVTDHFEAVFDIAAADYEPKPEVRFYEILLERHGLDPSRSVMIEDRAVNLGPAAALGMTTVWLKTGRNLGDVGTAADNIHFVTEDLVAWLEAAADEAAQRHTAATPAQS